MNASEFAFVDVVNVAVDAVVVSTPLPITGVRGPATLSIVGGGAYRVCADAACTANPAFTTAPSAVSDGQFLQLQVNASAAFSTVVSTTVTMGTLSATWSVTTAAQDITPNPFAFADQTGATVSTIVTSNIVPITGITGQVATSIAGGGSFRVCADAGCAANPPFASTASTITNGQYLQVRLTSSAAFTTAVSTVITVGTLSDSWAVTTAAQDTTPNPFAFTDQTGAALSTVVTSNVLPITGITGNVATSITAGGSYRVCADATCAANPAFITTAATIANGQYLQVRVTSSASSSTAVSTTVTVGTVADTWSVTTLQDTTPNAFAFTDQTGAALSTVVTSNILPITGITGNVATSIAGGGSYRICADATCAANPAFISAAGSITNGQYLQVRLTSSAAFTTAVTTAITVGTLADTWSVTTAAQDTTPNPFAFTDQAGAALSTVVTSNILPITGITGSVATGIAGGGAYRVCADATCAANPAFIATASTITNGQYLQVRLTSSGTFATAVSTTVTVGTVSDLWSVTTVAQDTTPNPFAFTDQTGVALSTVVTSNILPITGITGTVTTSIAGGGSYRICADATCAANPAFIATAGSITNGQYLQVRVTSSASHSTAVSATVTVGTVADTWSVTTVQDVTPDPFAYTDQTGVAPSTAITSNILPMTGVTGLVATSVSAGGAYRVCVDAGCATNPAFVTTPGTLGNGQYLQVRVTSSASYSTAVTTTVTVGTVSDTWSVTTARGITNAEVQVTASPNVLATPVAPGQVITWTAAVTGGGVPPYRFRFVVYDSTTAVWSVLREYNSAASLTWAPSHAASYVMQVWVRGTGSTAAYDAYYSSGAFTVSVPPGRWKIGPQGCYWEPNDWGSDQCSPEPTGRWKLDGNGACYWDENDTGPDQCSPEATAAGRIDNGGGANGRTEGPGWERRGRLAWPLLVGLLGGAPVALVAARGRRRRRCRAPVLRWGVVATALVLLLGAAGGRAQEASPFTGWWVAEPDAEAGAGPEDALRVDLRVTDSGAGLAVARRVARGVTVAEERYACPVDGPPTGAVLGSESRRRTVRREGPELVWALERQQTGRPTVRLTERWSVSADRQTLTVVVTATHGTTTVTSTQTFTRHGDEGVGR